VTQEKSDDPDVPDEAKRSAGEWKLAFLSALRNSGIVRLACELSGISRQTAYLHRRIDAQFAEAWEVALEEACDVLEAIALERAQQSSDLLLIFLLKARRPEKYRDSFRVTVDPIEKALERLPPEAVAEIRLGIAEGFAARSGDSNGTQAAGNGLVG